MQLSNGAIKVKTASAATLATKVEENEFEGVNLETFDLSAFVAPKPGAIAVRGSGKEIKNPEVDKFLTESAELLALGDKYEIDYVERGNKALYELLASIYGLSLRIEQHEQREKILDAVRTQLKEKRDITIKSGTPAINTMVKYVVRSDNRVISRYIKVLNIAREENLSPADLPAYIARRGGVACQVDVFGFACGNRDDRIANVVPNSESVGADVAKQRINTNRRLISRRHVQRERVKREGQASSRSNCGGHSSAAQGG